MQYENDFLDFINNYTSIELFSIEKNISIEIAKSIISRGKTIHYSNNPKSRCFTKNHSSFDGLSSMQKNTMKKRLNKQLLKEHSA